MRTPSPVFLFVVLIGSAAAAPIDYTAPTDDLEKKLAELPGPLSAAEGLASIVVGEGMRVELVAAEPLVMDPVDVTWGPDGKLWVVEMADYPLGCEGGGRVRFLEDEDGDGKYSRSTVFADGLNFPTGVMPWRDGVLVTAAPEILFLKDSDGDGRADSREVRYVGFEEGNQQHRVNGLQWGLDNWIHIANGDSGGSIRPAGSGESVNINGRDLRIRPDEGLVEAETGRTQYGRNRDDWGNWFGCSNSRPMWHFVLTDRYTKRNPHIAAPGAIRELQERAGPVFPASTALSRFNNPQSAGRFTSACGAMIYRDRLLGDGFYGNSFVAEPVHNLVHREVLRPEGVSFVSGRAPGEEKAEFFASNDNWCRPTAVRTGPDGALWIDDRFVIEHPQWIPDDWEARLDLRMGSDRGRIYRVLPEGVEGRPVRRLDGLDGAGLAKVLESSNGWERDMAHQMLLWRGGEETVPFLVKMVRESTAPLARMHALCVLDGLGRLEPGLVREALGDAHAGVRRHAVRLSENWAQEGEANLVEALAELAGDPDAMVRLQLTYSLGEFWENVNTAGRAAEGLWELWVGIDDPAMEAAVMSSAFHHRGGLVEIVLRDDVDPERAAALARRLLVMAVRLRMDDAMVGLIGRLLDDGGSGRRAQFAAVGEFIDALGKERMSLGSLHAKASEPVAEMIARADGIVAMAREVFADGEAPEGDRVAAAGLLGRGLGGFAGDLESMAKLLVPQTPVKLQLAAVESMGRLGRKEVAEEFASAWEGYGPAVRAAAFRAILSRRAWTDVFLAEAEKRPGLRASLGAGERQAFLQHATSTVRNKAAEVFGSEAASSRAVVLESYAAALKLEGDAVKGAEVFTAACAVCHKIGEIGREAGPDLTALTDKSKEALLVAILDPNRAVEDKFVQYVATTKDGRAIAGMVTEEAGNSVTLLGMDGMPQTVLRSELKSLSSTGRSLMPEGLEAAIAAQAMADLIEFVAGATGEQAAR